MILNLNLNGVVWSRIIETAANMVHLKEQDDGLTNIRFGGTGVYDDIYYNQYELRKSMIKSMLYLQKHDCIQYFYDLSPDYYHDTEIYLNDKIFYRIHQNFYFKYSHRGDLNNLITEVRSLQDEIDMLSSEKKSLFDTIVSMTNEIESIKRESVLVSDKINYKERQITEIKNQIKIIDNTIDI